MANIQTVHNFSVEGPSVWPGMVEPVLFQQQWHRTNSAPVPGMLLTAGSISFSFKHHCNACKASDSAFCKKCEVIISQIDMKTEHFIHHDELFLGDDNDDVVVASASDGPHAWRHTLTLSDKLKLVFRHSIVADNIETGVISVAASMEMTPLPWKQMNGDFLSMGG